MKVQALANKGWMQSSRFLLAAENRELTNKQNNNLPQHDSHTLRENEFHKFDKGQREPSLLTGTTKEFVTGLKTNLIF